LARWLILEALGAPKDVTLIIGMRCSDGTVLCADSQETFGGYRVSVQKLEAHTAGRYLFMLAGTGLAELIDGFVVCLRRKLEITTDDVSISTFTQTFESELSRYQKEDVAPYQAPKNAKRLRFIVAACANDGHDIWETKAARLKPIREYALIGWDEPLYKAILKKLYRPGISVSQAVLAGIYTMGVAEDTSNYVRGPMQVGGINDTGAWGDGPAYIADTLQRLRQFELQSNAVFLASVDIGMNLARYREALNDFTGQAVKLHKELVVLALRAFLASGKPEDFRSVNIAYDRIPPAVSLAIQAGDFDDVLGPGEKADLLAKLIAASKAAYRAKGHDG
jgi:20S proteasome alpha/beta subunit